MGRTIQSNYIDQFSRMIHNLVEQKESKTRSTISVEVAQGEKHFFDRLGEMTVKQVTTVNTPVDLQDAAHSRRMATVIQYGGAVTLSDFDRLKMIIDPTSDYAQSFMWAFGRAKDDEIIAAARAAREENAS